MKFDVFMMTTRRNSPVNDLLTFINNNESSTCSDKMNMLTHSTSSFNSDEYETPFHGSVESFKDSCSSLMQTYRNVDPVPTAELVQNRRSETKIVPCGSENVSIWSHTLRDSKQPSDTMLWLDTGIAPLGNRTKVHSQSLEKISVQVTSNNLLPNEAYATNNSWLIYGAPSFSVVSQTGTSQIASPISGSSMNINLIPEIVVDKRYRQSSSCTDGLNTDLTSNGSSTMKVNLFTKHNMASPPVSPRSMRYTGEQCSKSLPSTNESSCSSSDIYEGIDTSEQHLIRRGILKTGANSHSISPERHTITTTTTTSNSSILDNQRKRNAEQTGDSAELVPWKLRAHTAPLARTSRIDELHNFGTGFDIVLTGDSPRLAKKSVRFAEPLINTDRSNVMLLEDRETESDGKSTIPNGSVNTEERYLFGTRSNVAKINSDGPIMSVIYPNSKPEPAEHNMPPCKNPWFSGMSQSTGLRKPTDVSVGWPVGTPSNEILVSPNTTAQTTQSQVKEKPPRPIAHKPLNQLKPSRTGRLSYAELFGRQMRAKYEHDKYIFSASTSVGSFGSETSSDAESARSSGSAPVDRNHCLISSQPNQLSQTAFNGFRKLTPESYTQTPRIVNTAKLNKFFTSASGDGYSNDISKPLVRPTCEQKYVSLPDSIKASASGDNIETSSQFSRLNYNTSLNKYGVMHTRCQSVDNIPQYEGIQPPKGAFSIRKYTSDDRINVTSTRPISNREAKSDLYEEVYIGSRVNAARRQQPNSANTVRTAATAGGGLMNCSKINGVLPVDVQSNSSRRYHSLSREGLGQQNVMNIRLLQRRPRILTASMVERNEYKDDVDVNQKFCRANPFLAHIYTQNRHKIHPNNSSCSKESTFSKPPIVPNLNKHSESNPELTNGMNQYGDVYNIHPSILHNNQSPEYDNADTNLSTNSSSVRQPLSHSTSVPISTNHLNESIRSSTDNLSNSMMDFIDSERSCQQAPFNSINGVPGPIQSSRTPISSSQPESRTNNQKLKPSALSVEEARLLKSLERLNTRLCDILTNR